MEQVINFDTYETVALASLVLLLGYFLVKRLKFLKKYNIPEPVVGGFIIAVILFFTHNFVLIVFVSALLCAGTKVGQIFIRCK